MQIDEKKEEKRNIYIYSYKVSIAENYIQYRVLQVRLNMHKKLCIN